MNDFINSRRYRNIQNKSTNFNSISIKIIEKFWMKRNQFPYKYYEKLCPESKKLVELTESGDLQNQLEVGKCLIERDSDYPLDVNIGLKYVKETMKNGNKESAKYYIDMLIDGKMITCIFKWAEKFIKTIFEEDESMRSLMYGKLYKKEKQFG